MDIEQLTDSFLPYIPSSPLMGSPSIPDLPPSQPELVQAVPAQPPTSDTSHHDVFRQVAKALMGHDISYSVDGNGNTVATETPGKPGQFFRNVVTAALLGGAAGANGNPQQGFLGGLARGGAAGVSDARQQDLLKRQQAEQDFQNNQRSQAMQLEKNRDQRDQDAFATQETLRKAQVAQANAETYRLNMLTQGADFEQHQKLADQGKQHFADFDAAGLSPVFKGVPEAEMQDLIQNRPGASTFDWEATGVKLGTGPDGKPTYQYTYSAYDPKGKVPVSAGTIAQWKRDGMDKYYPELFGILKPGKEIDATHYIELKRLDSKLFGDNLVRQKADQDTAEGQARIHLQNAQAANAMAESYKSRLEGEVIKEGKNQQQATSLALSRLNDVNGDISKLSPKDRVLIGESANRMLATMGTEVSALLHAGDSDSVDQARAVMGEMDSVRRLALSPLIAGPTQSSGGEDPRVAAAIAHLKGKSVEEVEQALSDPRIPEGSKAAIRAGLGLGSTSPTPVKTGDFSSALANSSAGALGQ